MARQPETLAANSRKPHDIAMEARLAFLEEIASSTRAVLKEIRDDIRDLRSELQSVRDRQDGDLRLVFGALVAVALGLAGLMAKGFHWV